MERIVLTDQNIEEAAQKATEALVAGGVVLYPTDTLYGLAVDKTNPTAMKRLWKVKSRDESKLVSSILSDIDAATPYAIVTPLAQKLSDTFLPGKLTIVLESRDGGEFSVRVPVHPFCLLLTDLFGKPFTATSANKSGEPTLATPDKIIEQLGSAAENIDLIIDAGELPASAPSTVVDARGKAALILREGAISTAEILAATP